MEEQKQQPTLQPDDLLNSIHHFLLQKKVIKNK